MDCSFSVIPAFSTACFTSLAVFVPFMIRSSSFGAPIASPSVRSFRRKERSLSGSEDREATKLFATFAQGIFSKAHFRTLAEIPSQFASSPISLGLPAGIAAQNNGFDNQAIESPPCITPDSPFPIAGLSAAPAS